MLYELTNGNLAESHIISETLPYKKVCEYYYQKRLDKLNELIYNLAYNQYLEKD